MMRFDGADEVAGIAIMIAEDDSDDMDSGKFSSNGASEKS